MDDATFYAINDAAVSLSDLKERTDLTEQERALVHLAWQALTDAQGSYMRRTNARAA